MEAHVNHMDAMRHAVRIIAIAVLILYKYWCLVKDNSEKLSPRLG